MSASTSTRPQAMSAGELGELRAAVRGICARDAGPQEARRLLEATPDAQRTPQLWSALTTELGIGGLLVPERFGGLDVGWSAARVVLEELGRGLASVPFLASSVLATQLLLAVGDDEANQRLLPALADGTIVATVAVTERATGWDDWTRDAAPIEAEVTARTDGDQWTLSGRKRAVAYGAVADLVFVVAAVEDKVAVFMVESTAVGVVALPQPNLDATRPTADLILTDVPARLIGSIGATAAAVRRALDLGGLATAAEDAGAMRSCLEMSVEYALLRQQFDRPIGSFQAIKHKLADMLVRVELAEAAVEQACLAVDDETPDAAAAAVVAHATAAESFRLVAAETIQTHGGIGFTWEHPAHLYFRRAKTSQLSFGGAARYRERLLERLGLGSSS